MTGRRTAAALAVTAALVAAAAVSLAASESTVDAGAEAGRDPVQRIAGDDRFATAGELAGEVDGDTLWVATGTEFADALTASATGTGPVLLVTRDHAPQATLDAARSLDGIEQVHAVGGQGAVTDETVEEVAGAVGDASVSRSAGADRFDTAAQVSRETHPSGAATAYVATGLAFADALTASVAAADDDAPVLLAGEQHLPEATRGELDRLDVDEIVLVGGQAAVAESVESELNEHADWVTRVAGSQRFETAAAVSAHRGLEPADEAFLATGEDFPDVLAAAPAAVSADAALLLPAQRTLPSATRDELDRLGVDEATIAGGTSAVSEPVADEVRRLLGFDPGPAGEITVELFDAGQADAALIRTQDATMLVDAGHHQRDDVVDHLGTSGVTEELDVLALTHWHADHIGQVPAVLDAVDVDEVWTQPGAYDSATYDEATDAIEASDATVREPSQGDQHTVGDLTVDIVGPDDAADPGDVHDATLGLRVEHGDARALFTGDAEAATEGRYVDAVPQRLAAQLYQVGHHGSRTSTSQTLLDAVDPDHAVYSAGDGNTYGHPHGEVLDRLEAAGVDVFGTDANGTVTATSDGTTDWDLSGERDGTPAPGDDTGDGDDEPAGCVDINAENDLDELTRIIHIGEQRAHAVIDHRPYDRLGQLERIDGIGPSRVADIDEQGLAAVDC